LVEKLGVWYVLATAMGAALGAITNFLLGRHWAFDASHAPARGQALRYALVSLGSLLLNAGLVYLITEKLGVNYVGSKAVTALLVGVVYNFPLQRWFVFN
jgi:putative flippase GtrA